MLKERGVDTIIFDLGGVMVDLNFERCLSEFRALGFNDAHKLVSCYHPQGIFGELERGEIAGSVLCDYIREMSGLSSLRDEQIYAAYQSLLVGIPDYKLEMLKGLKEEGYKICALSNMSEVMYSAVLKFFGDYIEYFDHMSLSYQMGVMKPDSEIYEMLIEKGGVTPSQSLFIDDGEANITAARAFGFNVYHAKAEEDFRFLFL